MQFKKKMDRVLTQFRGYDQHDAIEFMGAMLTLIHEELVIYPLSANSLLEPEITSKDLENNSETGLARAAWKRHKKRSRHAFLSTIQVRFDGVPF